METLLSPTSFSKSQRTSTYGSCGDGAVADYGRIRVITRAKPADYIYTETEVQTFESLVGKVEDVIAKVHTATDNATTAANKAEAAVSKLPLPLGNTLKGEVESTMVSVHDAYPAPLVTAKVTGQSNQITTTGKNLANGMEEICSSSDLPTNLQNYCWGYSLGQNPLKLNQPLKAGTYTFSYYADEMATIYFSQAPYNGTKEHFAINRKAIGETKNGLNRYYGTLELKNDSDIIGIYSNYNKCCCGMLSEGTSLLPYEPYTGGKPSPSPDYPQEITNLTKAELVITGKNLINVGTIQSNRFNVQFNDADILSELNKLPRNIPLWFSCNVEPKGTSNGEIWFEGEGNNRLGIMRQDKAYIVPEGEIKSFRLIGGVNDASTRTYSNIQIAAVKSDFTNSDKAKHTPINLQGNELRSLPNGVKDEVVINADGNVSLIKRVVSVTVDGTNLAIKTVSQTSGDNHRCSTSITNTAIIPNGEAMCDRFTQSIIHNGAARTFYIGNNNTLHFVGDKSSPTTVDGWNEWFVANPTTVVYKLTTPQIIPLGKVELPALPEATSNVWNNGNIQTNVYIDYLKDVNIAYGKLENQIKQITMALSMMDTPTVISKISEDEPTLIPELEESPIEESSI